MKNFVFVAIFATLFGYFGCNTEGKNHQPIISSKIEFSIEPGEHWLGKMKVFIFSIKKSPQFAAWIEDNNENYVSTIAVSEKSVKGNWISAPREGRPEALPVWNHKQQNNTVTDDLDAASSATVKGSFGANLDGASLINGNTYSVFLEINHSFDYNDYWTKDNSGVNGQPSLIYHAQFIAGQSGRILLVPIGYGSVDGSDGNIVKRLDRMTTALTIIKDAYITIK